MLWDLVVQLHPIVGVYGSAQWWNRRRLRIVNVLYHDQVSMIAPSDYIILLRKISNIPFAWP